MADKIPAALKQADITRFAHRASQLEKFKPVIAYWCEYWIVNQILAKSLHNADEEALEYTTTLMDKLESAKRERASDPTITDDEQGKATCMKFAQETFDRAERAIDANRVSRQTADTFQAAATFFELANIWGAPDRETQAKIKYAKWNATRIFKAIREGRDPNESNPRRKEEQEEIPDEKLPALDPNDPEVRMLMGSGAAGGVSSSAASPMGSRPSQPFIPPMPKPVSMDEVPDQGEPRPNSAAVSPVDPQVSAPSSPLPSAHPSAPDQVSPLFPPSQPDPAPSGSYFPSMGSQPTPPPAPPPKISPAPSAPSAPSVATPSTDFYRTTPSQPTPPPNFVDQPPTLSSHHPQLGAPGAPYSPPTTFSPLPSYPTPMGYPHQTPPAFSSQPPPSVQPPRNPMVAQAQQQPPHVTPSSYAPSPQPYQHQHQRPQPQQTPQQAPYQPHQGQRFTTSEARMVEAQKHARWAISALNFEDVSTAVKELRIALDQLVE